MASLLESTPLSLEQQQYMMMIRTSGQVLLGIVNDVLDYSKLTSENTEVRLRFEPHNIAEIAESAIFQCYGTAMAKGLNLSWFIDPVIPPGLLFDNLRLQQILLNLLSNAIKFTKQGIVQLYIQGRWKDGLIDDVSSSTQAAHTPADTVRSAHKSLQITVEVRDTGVGISDAQLQLLFRPFAQVHHNSGEFGGTGQCSAQLIILS